MLQRFIDWLVAKTIQWNEEVGDYEAANKFRIGHYYNRRPHARR